MATDQINFDTKAMHALNANIMKCLEGMKVAEMLSKTQTPEERRLLARAADDYSNGHYNAAVTRYKSYVTSKGKLPVDSTEQYRLDVIVQYLVCKCLLHSSQFQDLTEAKKTLTDLEASVGTTYPMIYYALSKFYIAVFCFKEADRMSTKGLSVSNTGDFPVCYLPESQNLIKESTKEELTKLLLSLKEQCSGWHPPDARCFMTICRMTSQNHVCGRDIFLKSPAYNGMVTLTCSNTTNPCEIHFHCACWKSKKDEAFSIAKISDKEVLLNWECFTPNCGTENDPSVIKRITIHKEDGSVKDIETPLDKSNRHVQPSSSSKGAVRKQKHVIKINSSKVVKPKQSMEKNNETSENNHAVHHDVAGINVPPKSPIICDPFTLKAMTMITLRESNFNIKTDNDWRPNKAYYGNDHMMSTIDTSYEPDFSEDTDTVARIKTFLFSYFLSMIENNGPIKNDDLMKEWNSLIDCSDFEPISKNLNGIIEVRKFLLRSLKFVAIGNYICIPELLPGAYALTDEETELKVVNMMEKKTFDFGSMLLKRKKTSEVVSDNRSGKGKPSSVPGKSAKTEPVDPFILTPDDILDEEVEEEGENEEYKTTSEPSESSESHESVETPVKRIKVQEDVDVGGVKKNLEKEFIEEERNDFGGVDEQVEDDNLGQNAENEDQVNKNSKTSEIQVDEPLERYVVESESEGTLDDQDDLPWDGRTRLLTEAQTCRKCNSCRCDKLPDLAAIIAALQEELQSTREELQRSSERLEMSEENYQKTQDELQDTREELQNIRESLQNTRASLQKSREELKSEKHTFKETKRKLSRDVLDSEFNHNHAVITSKKDLTQSQYTIVAKLQNLVYQTTKNYMNLDWAEWAVPLEKLETMLSSLQEEHKRIANLLNSDKTPENNSISTHINMLNLLPLPQRNIPDLIEIAFNMLKNHFQPMVSYRRAMLPPGLTQGPPIIPLWYQQHPRYATPSIQPTPYHHHMLNPMMTPSQFPSNYSPGLQRETYSPYLGTPITITDVSSMPGCPPSPEQTSAPINEQVLKTPERTCESESSSSDKSEKLSGSNDKSQQTSNDCRESAEGERLIGLHEEEQPSFDVKKSVDVQVEVPVVPEIVTTDKEEEEVETCIQVPPPVPARKTPRPIKIVLQPQKMMKERVDECTPRVSTDVPASTVKIAPVVSSPTPSASSPAADPTKTKKDSKKTIEVPKASPPVKAQAVPASIPAPTVKVAPAVSTPTPPVSSATTDPKKKIKVLKSNPPVKPKTVASILVESVPLAASLPHSVAKKKSKHPEKVPTPNPQVPPSPVPQAVIKNAIATPPAKKLLKAIDTKANQAAKVPVQPVKKIVHHGIVKAKLTEQSTPPNKPQNSQGQERNNEVNGIEIKRPKMQSMDKLMYILRDRHPGVLEYDLIWSIKFVRKNHNDSLTGIPLVQIIAEVDKLISSRQKLQLIPYSSSNKIAPVKSQGVAVNVCPGRSGHDPNCSTSSASSFHRDHLTKMNPWSKPQDVSWIKESPEADCVICWETLITELKPPYTLKCQHTFHKKCLVDWFAQSRSCPTCRIHSTIDDEFPPLP